MQSKAKEVATNEYPTKLKLEMKKQRRYIKKKVLKTQEWNKLLAQEKKGKPIVIKT